MTIGQAIKKLVKKHGQGTVGLYILHAALAEALGVDTCDISIRNGSGERQLMCQTPKYLALQQLEKEIMAKYRQPHPESAATIATQ